MRVERQRVTDLPRSRGNDLSAELAARSLPATIDLSRDEFLLRHCGIHPNTVALDLNLVNRSGSPPPPAQPMQSHPVPEKTARPPSHDWSWGWCVPPRQLSWQMVGRRDTPARSALDAPANPAQTR